MKVPGWARKEEVVAPNPAVKGSTRKRAYDALTLLHLCTCAGAMAAKGVIHVSFGQERGELLEDGLDDVWWECGHGHAPSH